ncbi:MAG: nickel-binding protein [Bacteroidota bacterium]
MPLYMDRHYVVGATKAAVADAHDKDLAIQEKYPVKFYTYWFDEPRCTAFCLIEAPDRETIQKAHNEAHGLVPNEIIEVDTGVVEAFLGRVKDPTPVDLSGELPIDSAFRAIMFTDLKDSTLMTTVFGDTRALHLLHVHNAIIRNALREYHGNEVKHTGDGIMTSFANVEDAVNCAITVQRGFADHNRHTPEEDMHVRIGLSAGEPVEEDGDFFGSAVQLAARICAHTEPDHILVAQVVRDECKSHPDDFVNQGEITPKGFTTPICVHEVRWE